MRVSQPLASGLFFIAFGAFVLFAARGLQAGTAADMGTGYVPRILAWGCVVTGVLLLGQAWLQRMRLGMPHVTLALRPLALVTAMVVAFALLLPRIGLPVTVALIVLATIVSGEKYRPAPLVVIAIGMAVFTTLLFATALGLQIPVWPK